jgi:hypothetical protein
MRSSIAPVLALSLASCSLGLEVPIEAQITCAADSECPDGYTCYTNLNTCVRTGGDLTQPAIVDGVIDLPQRIGTHGSQLHMSFQVDRDLATEPKITAQWAGVSAGSRAVDFVAFDQAARRYDYVYTVGDDEPEGFIGLSFELLSAERVPARFDLPRIIELDFLAPDVAPGTVSRDITPPAGSLVQDPDALGAGSSVAIRFAATEALSSLAIETTPSALAFSCAEPIGTFYTCTFTLGAAVAEGDYQLTASLTDLAGNNARVALLGGVPLTLDATVPPVPAVATTGAITYRRAPYGSAARNGATHFDIRGAAGAVEPGSTVVVFDDPDVASAAELGRATADALGGFAATDLVRADRPRIYITVLDRAGNPSDDSAQPGLQASLVRDVEWIGTLAGKTANDTFSNPHSFRERGWFGPSLDQHGAIEVGDDDGMLARADGEGPSVVGAGSWAHIDPSSVGSSWSASAVRDSWRGITWNMSPTTPNRWNGHAFATAVISDPEGDGNPVPGTGGYAAFDDRRGEVVWFSSDSNVHETWAWNGASWRFLTGSGPPSLSGAAMVFDSRRGEVVLFGGTTAASTYSTTTWIWDGVSWHDAEVAGPTGREEFDMVYDSGRGKTVLFGGQRFAAGACDGTSCGGSNCALADTWEWSGIAWSKICDGTTADCGVEPGIAAQYHMAFDAKRGVTVLFGGSYRCVGNDLASDFANDVWEWNGTAWSHPTITDPEGDGNPGGRAGPSLFYDPLRQRVLLTGGENEFASPLTAQYAACVLWAWNGSSFQRVYDMFNPTAASCAGVHPSVNTGGTSMAYDPSRKSLVVTGSGFAGSEDTWELRNGSWTNFAGGLTDRTNAGLASIPTGVAIFGGFLPSSSNTYSDLWDRVGTTWTQRSTTGPGNRTQGNMTYVADDQVLLLVGGGHSAPSGGSPCVDGGTSVGTFCYLADSWGYAQWGTPTCASAGVKCWKRLPDQTRAMGASVTYDASRGITTAFGGQSNGFSNAVTREWDGVAWATRSPAAAPSARANHGSAYDVLREKSLIVGGASSACLSSACKDVWEWDGTIWRERTVADIENDGSMAGRTTLSAAYVPAEGGTYVYGGNVGDTGLSFYRWDGGFAASAGHAAHFDFSTAGAGAAGAPEYRRIDVHWVAGGRGEDVGTVRGGVALQVWLNGAWVETKRVVPAALGQAGDVGAPTQLDWCAVPVGGAAECDAFASMENFFAGRELGINAGAATAFPNGRTIGQLVTDYVEVMVTYREAP